MRSFFSASGILDPFLSQPPAPAWRRWPGHSCFRAGSSCASAKRTCDEFSTAFAFGEGGRGDAVEIALALHNFGDLDLQFKVARIVIREILECSQGLIDAVGFQKIDGQRTAHAHVVARFERQLHRVGGVRVILDLLVKLGQHNHHARIRILLDGLLQHVDGVRQIAAVGIHHSQPVERVFVVRVGREHLPVGLLGVGFVMRNAR